MKKSVLLTGISGFCCSHLADYIDENHPEYNIHGLKRYRSNLENIDHILDKLTLHNVDVTDAHSVNDVIKEIKPDKIFHLAAMSYVPSSWTNPKYTIDVNVGGTINILEAIKNYSPDTIVQLSCSSEQYGHVLPDETPINENNIFRPISPYAVSKIAVENLGYQYHKSYGLKTIITRAFNHSGERRNENFIISNFTKQALEVKNINNKKEYIYVGNLESIRDFTHVKDMVRAYWLATEKCDYGTPYNIASGIGYKIGDVLDKIIKISGLTNDVIRYDKSRMRPSDVPILIGDSKKFRDKTGWIPQYNIDDIIYDLNRYWLDKMMK